MPNKNFKIEFVDTKFKLSFNNAMFYNKLKQMHFPTNLQLLLLGRYLSCVINFMYTHII